MIGSFVVSRMAFNLFDDGIANVLGLETLRHGTNLPNYLSICAYGGDPKQGGKVTGSTQIVGKDTIYVTNVKGYFHLFKDSEFSGKQQVGVSSCEKESVLICSPGILRVLPKLHAFLSGYAFGAGILPEQSTCLKPLRCFLGAIGVVSSLMTPTLKFRYAKIDHSVFKNDEDYGGFAYKTQNKVEAWRLGVLGSLLTGFNCGWFARVKANPIKVLTGAIQLISAVALVALLGSVLFAHPGIAVLGLLLV